LVLRVRRIRLLRCLSDDARNGDVNPYFVRQRSTAHPIVMIPFDAGRPAGA
jgi:hypothetical protein